MKRLVFSQQNFLTGFHSFPKSNRNGMYFAAAMRNLRGDSEGVLSVRYPDEQIDLGVRGIEGIAADGQGGLFFHTGDRLYWHDGSLARETLTNTGGSVSDLRGALSSVTTFVDYVLLTGEGEDSGYLADMSGDAPVAYSMEVPAPPLSANPGAIDVHGTDVEETGVWIPEGDLYYLRLLEGSDPPRYRPAIALPDHEGSAWGIAAPPMVWEYALTYVRRLELGEEDDRVKLGEMESALGRKFYVALHPKADGADDAFQYVNFSAWTFPEDESIYKINLYRRPFRYLSLPEGAEGVEDTVETQVDFEGVVRARRVYGEIKEDGYRTRDAVVDRGDDHEWDFRYVGSVEREEGLRSILRDEFDNVNVAGTVLPHHTPPRGESYNFRYKQIFEDASARAFLEASASGMPESASSIAEYNTRIFAACGEEARYSEIDYGNLLPWAYPPENSLRYPTRCIFNHYGILYFGSPEGLWRLTGIEAEYDVDKVSDAGPVSSQAWSRSRTGSVLFIGSGGLWELRGSYVSPFGSPYLDGFFEGRRCVSGSALFLPNGSALFTLGWESGGRSQVFFSKTGGFQTWEGVEFSQGLLLSEDAYALTFSGDAHKIVWQSVDYIDSAGYDISWAYETQRLDWSQSGLADRMKHFRFADMSGSAGSVRVEVEVDGEVKGSRMVELDGASHFPSRVPIRSRGRWAVVRLLGRGALKLSSLRVLADVPERRFP